MDTLYEPIRRLMAEAERRHQEIDREFETRLAELLQGRGSDAPVAHQNGGTSTPEPPAMPKTVTPGPARKGEVRSALRALMKDRRARKLNQIGKEIGRGRNATYAALKRMTYDGEVESLGNGTGMYRGTEKLAAMMLDKEGPSLLNA